MHYHANTRTDVADAKALGDVYTTHADARTAVLAAVGEWVAVAPHRRITEASEWDAPHYTATGYDSHSGEQRTWSTWGCTCAQGEVDAANAAKPQPATTCDTCGRDDVTGPHTVTNHHNSRPCTGQPVAVEYTAKDDTLGPCGCTDYHMADCPTRTGGTGYTMDDLLAHPALLDNDR